MIEMDLKDFAIADLHTTVPILLKHDSEPKLVIYPVGNIPDRELYSILSAVRMRKEGYTKE